MVERGRAALWDCLSLQSKCTESQPAAGPNRWPYDRTGTRRTGGAIESIFNYFAIRDDCPALPQLLRPFRGRGGAQRNSVFFGVTP